MSTVFLFVCLFFIWLFKDFLKEMYNNSLSSLSSLKPRVTVKVKETQEKTMWTQRRKNNKWNQSMIRFVNIPKKRWSGGDVGWNSLRASLHANLWVHNRWNLNGSSNIHNWIHNHNLLLKPQVNGWKDQQDSKDVSPPPTPDWNSY